MASKGEVQIIEYGGGHIVLQRYPNPEYHFGFFIKNGNVVSLLDAYEGKNAARPRDTQADSTVKLGNMEIDFENFKGITSLSPFIAFESDVARKCMKFVQGKMGEDKYVLDTSEVIPIAEKHGLNFQNFPAYYHELGADGDIPPISLSLIQGLVEVARRQKVDLPIRDVRSEGRFGELGK